MKEIVAVSNDLLESLLASDPRRFADWPDPTLPRSGPGAYTIWNLETGQFVYVGIAGTQEPRPGKLHGLARRLAQHASGDRSGDRSCICVQDRFILPQLSAAQIIAVVERRLSMDELVRDYVRNHLWATGLPPRRRRLRRAPWRCGSSAATGQPALRCSIPQAYLIEHGAWPTVAALLSPPSRTTFWAPWTA